MENFEQTIKNQIIYIEHQTTAGYNTPYLWEVVPLKHIPELDINIVHQYTDINMKGWKYRHHNDEEVLLDWFCEYQSLSRLQTDGIYHKRWKWNIEFMELDWEPILVKTYKSSDDIFIDSWIEFLDDD